MDKKKLGAIVGVVGVAGAVTAIQFVDMDHSKADFITRNLVEEYAKQPSQATSVSESSAEIRFDRVYDSAQKVEFLVAGSNAKPEESSKEQEPEESVSEAPAESSSREESSVVVEAPVEQPVQESSEEEPVVESYAFQGIVTADFLNIRSEANFDAASEGTFKQGDVVIGVITGNWISFGREDGTTGYVHADFVREASDEEIGGRVTGESTLPPQESSEESSETPQATEVTMWTTTELNIRAKASKDADVVQTLAKGTSVTGVIRDGWMTLSDGSGFVSAEFLTSEQPEPQPEPTPQPEPQPEPTPQPQPDQGEPFSGYVQVASANVRKGPGVEYDPIDTLPRNTYVEGKRTEAWVAFDYNGTTAYVSAVLLGSEKVAESSEQPPESSSQEKPEESSSQENPQQPSSTIEQIVSAAYGQLGTPYIFGGSTPGYALDCSGFTLWLYKTYAGISLPHDAEIQAQYGWSVSRENLQPGDLLFFNNSWSNSIEHVGIYVGDGTMIHASYSNSCVVTADINSSYYVEHLVAIRRLVN